ncbi:type II secretion system protein N [uncultured Algimonas sp.]|uniref:type II secretion system protein N n=1 Tax=uncultured Algimonas sp. TaxID=1547920 RepID=UPI0026134F13|nr:type II secretion system protein N [uncultured Algimonas sp.]
MSLSAANPMIASATPLLWLRRALLLCLTGLAAWLGVKLLLALAAPSSRWDPVLVAGPVAASGSSASATAYDFTYNPFEAGDANVDIEPIVDMGDDAPETTLDLELVGLRSGENGTAFVRTPDGQDRNYYLSDEIMPNVVLRGVLPGFVLIEVNGQTQRLTMDDSKASVSSSSPRRSADPGLQTLRSADAATLLSQFDIRPSFDDNGARNGVTVQPRSAGVELSTYGLRDGDVITRFAGEDVVTGMPDPVSLRRQLSNGQPVAVDIIRDGQPMTITIGSAS